MKCAMRAAQPMVHATRVHLSKSNRPRDSANTIDPIVYDRMEIQIVARVKNSPERMLYPLAALLLHEMKRRSDSGSEKQAVDNSEKQHARRLGKGIEQRDSDEVPEKV